MRQRYQYKKCYATRKCGKRRFDSYEGEQRKLFEAHWAQKEEQNNQIQAELERIKRNQDGVAREKATFLSWVTAKQRESQSMSEAAELCSKPVVMAEPVPAQPIATEPGESVLTTANAVGSGAHVKVV
ncbi:MAG TPA: hypothetical protein VGH37_15100 [Candidatus Acidoferrum sp.]|jgi:endonuclease/exonuclease/phosphatase (EEP) superfamily protein YafD